jgi:hypothetical protein
MEKKEFFKEPGANQILQGKIRKIKTGNLVTIIEKLPANYAYVIDHNIIPEVSKEGIPYVLDTLNETNSSKTKEELAQRFLKRGPLIELNNNDLTLAKAINSKKTMLDLRREYFNNLKIDEFELAGYGFWGIRDRRHRRLNLVSCIKGARLYAYSQLNKEESELIKLLEYDLKKEDAYLGADVIMEVPSERITLPNYDITLRSVPVKDVKEKYSVIYDFDADHTCKFRSTRITKRFTSRESFLDFHICAAYLAFADYEYRTKKNLLPLEMCPFVIPTQKIIDFYRKLVNNVVVIYNNEDKKIKRATNQAEREILLWHFVEKYGHDETCFAKKKLKEYKW